MIILVTGADGFLGGHVTSILLEEGHTVRALYHPASSRSGLNETKNLEIVEGDLLIPETLEPAFKGIEAVIHTAASTMLYPRKHKSIWSINFQGTQNLAKFAEKHSIKRFVCIGTANSFGSGSLENPGTERNPFTGGHFGSDYMDSKRSIQEWLLNFYDKTGFPVIILNPSYMLGPGDSKPGSGVILLRLRGRKLIPVSKGGRNFVSVKDVARAAVNALSKGRIGECYICGNENLPFRKALPLFAKTMGMEVPTLSIPSFFVLAFGALSSLVAKVTRKEPLVSFMMSRTSLYDQYYSPEKARRELDLPQTSVETAALEAFTWFQENGYCD
jgi:dihydroflavonol-4-reductase